MKRAARAVWRFWLAGVATLAVALAFLLILSAAFVVGALCVVAYVCWPYGDAARFVRDPYGLKDDEPEAQSVPSSQCPGFKQCKCSHCRQHGDDDRCEHCSARSGDHASRVIVADEDWLIRNQPPN